MGLSYFYSAEFIRWPSTSGTREAQLEPYETPSGLGTREAQMELREALLCIVRWQEIISPSYYPLLELREAQLERPARLLRHLERAKRLWNGPTGLRAP